MWYSYEESLWRKPLTQSSKGKEQDKIIEINGGGGSAFIGKEKDKSQEVMKVKEECGTALIEQLKKDNG